MNHELEKELAKEPKPAEPDPSCGVVPVPSLPSDSPRPNFIMPSEFLLSPLRRGGVASTVGGGGGNLGRALFASMSASGGGAFSPLVRYHPSPATFQSLAMSSAEALKELPVTGVSGEYEDASTALAAFSSELDISTLENSLRVSGSM